MNINTEYFLYISYKKDCRLEKKRKNEQKESAKRLFLKYGKNLSYSFALHIITNKIQLKSKKTYIDTILLVIHKNKFVFFF